VTDFFSHLSPTTQFALWSVVKILCVVFLVLLPMVAYSVLAERKISAFIQDRVGPNRVAPPLIGKIPFIGPLLTRWGIWQPLADGLKSFLKEDFTPDYVRKVYFWLAPAIALIPAFLTVAVIPFGSNLGGQKMVIADLNVGILYTFGIVSLGVYGIVLAGYAANSKYPFLGGIRSSAQMISYEIAMGMSVIPVFMIIGDLNLSQIIAYQAQHLADNLRADFVCDLSHLIFCGNQSSAVRFAGSRNRTRRRLQHRIQLDEIRALFHGRIREHDHWFGDDGRPLFRRLDVAVRRTGSTRDQHLDGPGAHRHFHRETARVHGDFHLGALDVSALPLRPIDGSGLEKVYSARAGKHFGNSGGALDEKMILKLSGYQIFRWECAQEI